MRIRPAEADDAEAISALVCSVQMLHAVARPDLFVSADERAIRAFVDERLAGDSTLLVAELDAAVVGYLLADLRERPVGPFRRPETAFHIQHLAVAASSQRIGVGAALIAEARRIARRAGASVLRLDSSAFNETAHAFFRAQGLEPESLTFGAAIDSD